MAKTRKNETSSELTEAEWAVIKVVWQNEPCTAGAVQEALARTRDWAYSTVKTTMDRMVIKGLLKLERIRNLQLFRSCISENEARRGEFRKMLQRAFDGTLTPMMQFLVESEELTREDIDQLRQLADQLQSGVEKHGADKPQPNNTKLTANKRE